MLIRILGAAAGGGLPQWNCRCPNCASVRAGVPSIARRTQSSLAVSADDKFWYLLNVSPDVRQQIHAFPGLAPVGGQARGTAIAGAVLTDSEIDHTTGLLLLREGTPFPIYSTGLVHHWLNAFYPIEPILSAFSKRVWNEIQLGQPMELADNERRGSGLEITAFPLDAHPPRFVTEATPDPTGSVIGLVLHDTRTGAKAVYAPGVARIIPELERAVEGADAVFMDGTFWTEDEMIRLGLSDRYAKDMGHIPVGDANGSLAWFRQVPASHRVFIHINNTNPMLNTASPEFEQVRKNGIHVGADGDTFEL